MKRRPWDWEKNFLECSMLPHIISFVTHLIYKKVYGDFRRLLLRRFPYAIYFVIENDEVIVTGLFHCARNPGKTKKNLSKRNKTL
jgi:hypothetical protein